MNCKTCVHWVQNEDAKHEFADGGYCGHGKVGEDYYSEEAYQPDALVYSYLEGGRFWTGPEFGCVHHKGKE